MKSNENLLDQLIIAFQRDEPFTMDCLAVFDMVNKSVIWFGDGMDYDNSDIINFRDNKRYIIIDGISHGEWHTVFISFLQSISKEAEYIKSIGGTLKKLTNDERDEWSGYKYNYAEMKAQLFLNQYGNTPTH